MQNVYEATMQLQCTIVIVALNLQLHFTNFTNTTFMANCQTVKKKRKECSIVSDGEVQRRNLLK